MLSVFVMIIIMLCVLVSKLLFFEAKSNTFHAQNDNKYISSYLQWMYPDIKKFEGIFKNIYLRKRTNMYDHFFSDAEMQRMRKT